MRSTNPCKSPRGLKVDYGASFTLHSHEGVGRLVASRPVVVAVVNQDWQINNNRSLQG